jgi:hypothetical protein
MVCHQILARMFPACLFISDVFTRTQALQLIDDISDRVMLKYKHSGRFDRDTLLKKLT